MKEYKILTRTIYLISFLLISEPVMKVVMFKLHSGLPWDTVWNNIVENGHSFSRFFMFWVLSPLAGVFLLSFSTISYIYYFLLSLFRVYLLLSYTPFSWPYFTERPHGTAIAFEIINTVLLCYLLYPYFQRFFLSRYFRRFFDARGRMECNQVAYIYIENALEPIRCKMVNISSGGARIEHYLTHDFKGGKILFKDYEGHPLCFDFKVAARMPEGQVISMGIEFEELSPRDKIFLRSCIYEEREKITT